MRSVIAGAATVERYRDDVVDATLLGYFVREREDDGRIHSPAAEHGNTPSVAHRARHSPFHGFTQQAGLRRSRRRAAKRTSWRNGRVVQKTAVKLSAETWPDTPNGLERRAVHHAARVEGHHARKAPHVDGSARRLEERGQTSVHAPVTKP
ncbi:MAG: hypothetical protein IPG50_26365 [Myxococcales bacterium]|nr:hypothetical protein [Myxococcales bacterium]